MKAKCYRNDGKVFHPCEPEEATHVEINVPGPFFYRILPVCSTGSRDKASKDRREPVWSWNADPERPTFKPSINTRVDGTVCHSSVTDGKIQFLGDCTHEHAGKTLDLYEIEDD